MIWLLSIVLIVALVVLLFPLPVHMDFNVNADGLTACFRFFGKKFYTYEKKFGKDADEPADEHADDSRDDVDDVVPEYVPPPRKTEPRQTPEPAPKVEPVTAVEAVAAPERNPVEKMTSPDSAADVKPATVETAASEPKSATVETAAPQPEKRKNLTDFEFWTLLLTPDLDERAFRYVKSLLAKFIWMFRIRFSDCFVEGIRSDYVSMGYGAALNGIMKSFPWLCDWELCMDWCNDHELKSAGTVTATVNLCRILAFLAVFLVYGSVLGMIFWHRRSHVLKTNELPELGYVRRKIRGWMVEE